MISTLINQAMRGPLEYAKTIAYSSEEVLTFTYRMAQKYANSPGVYVECGVATGAQVIAMAAGAPNKTIYALDSFEGIPLPSNKDDQMPGIQILSKTEQMMLPDPGKQVLVSSGATAVSLADTVQHIKISGVNLKKIYFVKGWFEETLPEFDCPPISILRLDGDLYNSTYVALKYLYPKVVKGGLVIIDDWALTGCREAARDYYKEQMSGERGEDYIFLDWQMGFINTNESTVAYWTK